MAKIPYDVNLLTTSKQFEKLTLNSTRSIINKILPKVATKAEAELKIIIEKRIRNTYTYQSILGSGDTNLRYHFGLRIDEAVQKLDSIVNILLNEIRVVNRQVRLSGNKLTGGLTVFIFRNEFDRILSSDAAFVTTDKGEDLHWLRWLLIEGNKVIIKNYDIEFGKFHPRHSRSGGAIMVETERANVFGNSPGWKVPSRFAGTIRSNWLTKFVETLNRLIEDVIQKSFKKVT